MTRAEGTRIKIPREYFDELKAQKVSWSIFAEKEFSLDDVVANITWAPEKMQPQLVKNSEQIDDFIKVMQAPFLKPYIYIISGRPNDVKASCVAAALLIHAS